MNYTEIKNKRDIKEFLRKQTLYMTDTLSLFNILMTAQSLTDAPLSLEMPYSL